MVIYYEHPLTVLFLGIATISIFVMIIVAVIGFAEMMANHGEETESSKTLGNVAGWCLLLIAIGMSGMCILNYNQDRPLSNIDSYISVENSMVTIEPLPKHHLYYKFDNDTRPNSENRQVFKFVENPEYKSAYLVTEDGGKLKLSDEDKEYLKQRMDK